MILIHTLSKEYFKQTTNQTERRQKSTENNTRNNNWMLTNELWMRGLFNTRLIKQFIWWLVYTANEVLIVRNNIFKAHLFTWFCHTTKNILETWMNCKGRLCHTNISFIKHIHYRIEIQSYKICSRIFSSMWKPEIMR